MDRMRRPIGVLAAFGVVATTLCMWRAYSGDASWMEHGWPPLVIVAFVSWWGALASAGAVAKASHKIVIPGLSHFYGLAVGFWAAPIWCSLLAGGGLIAMWAFGGSGSVHGTSFTVNDARIVGSTLIVFLSVSIPTLFSPEPAARWRGLTTRWSGRDRE